MRGGGVKLKSNYPWVNISSKVMSPVCGHNCNTGVTTDIILYGQSGI